MKAAICEKYGPPEVVKIVDRPKPVAKKNEVLIKVMASSVNSGDARMRSFNVSVNPWIDPLVNVAFRIMVGFRGPRMTLGAVVSGIVEEVGEGVTKFKPGDEVFAMTGMKFGGHAEYTAINLKRAIALKPKKASFEEAAALPFGGTTALFFLRKAGIDNAKKVLIYGATGAVGSAAVQIAHDKGVEVTAVAGPDGQKLSKKLGATKVFDYKKADISELKDEFDVIFDAVGYIDKTAAKQLLADGGSFVSVASMDVAKELSSDLEILAEMYDAGKLDPVIDSKFAFKDMVKAYKHVDSGRKKGNVVLTIQ